jgi:hypothetical protein
MVANTEQTGFYAFLAGDSTVVVAAVNPPTEESDLTRIARADLETRIGPEVVEVRRAGAWDRAIFRTRQGPELWRGLLVAALLLLLLESALAAAGRARREDAAGTAGEAARGTT